MNKLDMFFEKLSQLEVLSNCCGAKPMGEIFRKVGRCSDCLEMAEFEED